MTKIKGSYTIRSKARPDEIFFICTHSDDIQASIAWHIGMMKLSAHPNPVIQNHVIKYGIKDIDFSIDTPIEKAVINVRKEKRGKIKEVY